MRHGIRLVAAVGLGALMLGAVAARPASAGDRSVIVRSQSGIAGSPGRGVPTLGASPATIVGVSVLGARPWTDTGVMLEAGDQVQIAAIGLINITNHPTPLVHQPPDGTGVVSGTNLFFCSTGGQETLPFQLGGPGVGCWSMIARIGTTGTAFEAGSAVTFTAASSGELYLGPNDNDFSDNSGAWQATVNFVTARCVSPQPCDATAAATATASAPGLSVDVTGTPPAGVGTMNLRIASGSLPCPKLPSRVTPVTKLTDTGFPTTGRLSVTATLPLTSSTGVEQVCFNSTVPFKSQSSPTVKKAGSALLLNCSQVANVAPCVQSSKQVGSNIVVAFVVPGGDPRFYIVCPKGREAWLSHFGTGKVGTPFSTHLQTIGGVGAVRWSVLSGTLPPGMRLNPSTGAIVGTPTTSGSFPIVIQAVDSRKEKTSPLAIPLTVS